MNFAKKWLILLAVLAPMCAAHVAAQGVSYQRLVNADKEPQNWLMYDGNYRSQRFSRLDQVNKQNVAQLKPVWIYQPTRMFIIEDAPIVVDGVIYVVEQQDTVTALDAKTGRQIWTWTPVLRPSITAVGVTGGAGQTNRGVAVLDNMVYIGTFDDHLVALDATTGAVRWNTTVIENDKYENPYAITSAPLAIDGKIIIGIGGGDGPAKCFIDAYDAKTGKRLWRLYTVPHTGEPGAETWGNDMSGMGGGGTWNTGSYDPELNLLYWGTGNPSPDFNGDGRPGDDLYTDSVLAIDPSTGKIKWHFQFTPHDTHDWDSNQIPVLTDTTINGKPRKLLLEANRNGFYYVLDRETGEFLAGNQYGRQTWAKGLDAKGRPIEAENNEPSLKGTEIYPITNGVTNWDSPAFNPLTNTFFVNVREVGGIFYKGDPRFDTTKPASAGGGGRTMFSGDDAAGWIRALDGTTGKKKWDFKMLAPGWTSVLTTATGLVFSESDEGNFFALDADTGKPLWQFPLGGQDPRANPITYSVGGKQYILAADGNDFAAFTLP